MSEDAGQEWGSTRVQCIECGEKHTAVHPLGADLFQLECPYCGDMESLPVGFEAGVLDSEPEDWADVTEEALGTNT